MFLNIIKKNSYKTGLTNHYLARYSEFDDADYQ